MSCLYTIGFTEKSAKAFFSLLSANDVKKLIDTRVNNASQLSGFAKGKDLEYFVGVIGGISYEHRLDMAPTRELLADYRSGNLSWVEYTKRYVALLDQRSVLAHVTPADLDRACLLCSEHLPDRCHRRLLAEHIQAAYPEIVVVHLV